MTTPPAQPGAHLKLDWRIRLLVARVSAYLIDVLITAAIVGAAQGAIWLAGLNPLGDAPTASALHAWVTTTVTLPVFVYFATTTYLFGATVGHRALNLRVTPKDGDGRLPILRTILRYLVILAPFELNHFAMFEQSFLALLGVYLFAALILGAMVLQPEGRGLQDLVAGSKVIRSRAHPE